MNTIESDEMPDSTPTYGSCSRGALAGGRVGRACRGRSARRVDHALQRVAPRRAVHDAVVTTGRGSMPPQGVIRQRGGRWRRADSG